MTAKTTTARILNKTYSNARVFLKARGLPNRGERATILASVEIAVGRKCDIDPHTFVRAFVDQCQAEVARGSSVRAREFRPLQLPKDMVLAAAKSACHPIPISMTSRITNPFQNWY
jgi:hypothetical protein